MIHRSALALPMLALLSLAACNQSEDAAEQNAVAGNASVAAAGTSASAPTATAGSGQMLPDKSIAANLAASPDHSSLLAAVKAAGLGDTFAGSDPYTIFAPSNAAFAKLPGGTMDSLLKPEGKGQLTTLLTYHAVPGVVAAADLARAVEAGGGTAELATLGGTNLKISGTPEALVVTDAKGGQARITQADMLQSNGVIHVVDTVLMPE
jgi:uncharacterized surface protein with fasciclin (FAS1) repeats